MSWITAFRQFHSLMYIAKPFQTIIASSKICRYRRSRNHKTPCKRNQASSGSIRNSQHPNPTETLGFMYFNRNRNKRLSSCLATTPSTLILATNQGFVDFNTSAQFVSTWSYHGWPQFMEPTPGSLITSQTKNSLKSKGVSTKFLTPYIPDSLKPKLERLPCSLKDRPSRNGNIMSAHCASDQVCPDLLSFVRIAYRADETPAAKGA